MFIYQINFIFIVLWAFLFCFRRPSKIKNIVFLILSFGQMFLLSIFRVNIGFDYQMYVEGFYRMGMDGFSNLSYLDWEIGFVLFTKVVAFFTKNHIIYLGIISLFCLGSSARFIYKYSRMPWLSTILFVNLYFFYLSMNFLRQSIAIAIILFAWGFLKNQKFIPFLMIIALAATFHTTALIMIAVYVILKIQPSLKLLLLYCYALVFFYISSDGFLDLITSVFHQEYRNSIFLQGLSFTYAIFPIVIALIAMIYKKQLTALSQSNHYLISLTFLTAFLMTIMSKHAILERFSYYSYIFIILLIPEIIYAIACTNRKVSLEQITNHNIPILSEINNRYKLLAILSIFIITYGVHLYGMFENVHGAFPYNTWLIETVI